VLKHFASGKLQASANNDVIDLGQRLKDPNYELTFSDLNLLHLEDPAHFKQLAITAYNNTDSIPEVFSFATAPNISIATAMRSSMSIPALFQPVMMRKNGLVKRMADGGLGANLASHISNPYATGGARASQQREGKERLAAAESFAKTMVMGFDDHGRSQSVLFQNNKARPPSLIKRIFGVFFTKNLAETMKADDDRLHEAAPRAVVLKHEGLDTTTFDAPRPTIEAAQRAAEASFLEQLRRNGVVDKDHAMHVTYKTPEEAAESMSEGDLRAFYDSHSGSKGNEKDNAKQRLSRAPLIEAAIKRLENKGPDLALTSKA